MAGSVVDSGLDGSGSAGAAPPVGADEGDLGVGVALDGPPALMDEVVVLPAQPDQVARVGRAAVRPVAQVVAVPDEPATAREPAGPVPVGEGACLDLRHRTALELPRHHRIVLRSHEPRRRADLLPRQHALAERLPQRRQPLQLSRRLHPVPGRRRRHPQRVDQPRRHPRGPVDLPILRPVRRPITDNSSAVVAEINAPSCSIASTRSEGEHASYTHDDTSTPPPGHTRTTSGDHHRSRRGRPPPYTNTCSIASNAPTVRVTASPATPCGTPK